MSHKATVSLSLRLIEETTTVVIGEDAEGDRRQFSKADLHSCIVSRRFESVSLVMDRAAFRKIKPMKHDLAPSADKKVVRKKRKCLSCRHPFMAHPSTFICPPCKKTTAWRMGGDFTLAH